jgi:hypothetical protein
MQPTTHQEEKPIFIGSMSRFTFQCIVGCVFYSAGLIIIVEVTTDAQLTVSRYYSFSSMVSRSFR